MAFLMAKVKYISLYLKKYTMKNIYLISAIALIALFAFKVDVKSNKINNKTLIGKAKIITTTNKKTLSTLASLPPQATANTTPFLRYWNPILKRHYFTSNPNELGAGKYDWVFEKTVGWLRIVSTAPYALNSFYNPSTSGHYFSLTTVAPPGFSIGTVQGGTAHPPDLGLAVTEYKTLDGKDYMYVTTTQDELLIGWVNDGVVFNVLPHSF
jgi:hypothetical protein